MGYNPNNYRRIRQEYETKYLDAREAAETRRAEVHAALPEVAEIDRKMNGLGLELMRISFSGEENGSDSEGRVAALRAANEQYQRKRRVLLAAAGYPPDYTEIKYACPDCADTGFIDCRMCHCMREKLVLAGYESSGMADLLRKQSFDNFSLDYYRDSPAQLQQMTRVRDIMKRYADTFVPGESGNLVLFGGTGLGKTHLSTSVARVVIDKGCDVYYAPAVGLIADFERERFGNASGNGNGVGTERYYDCDLLIVDDLGTEVTNQFTTSVLYDVINTRLVRHRATVLNTNLAPEDFRKRYWDRITSRVLGEYTVLLFSGTDVRLQKLRKK